MGISIWKFALVFILRVAICDNQYGSAAGKTTLAIFLLDYTGLIRTLEACICFRSRIKEAFCRSSSSIFLASSSSFSVLGRVLDFFSCVVAISFPFPGTSGSFGFGADDEPSFGFITTPLMIGPFEVGHMKVCCFGGCSFRSDSLLQHEPKLQHEPRSIIC